MYQEEKTL